MGVCRGCSGAAEEILGLGPQPVCNRYLKDAAGGEFTRALALEQCAACGLVQLGAPMPAAEVLARFDWITYREPEGHLDELAETLAGLPELPRGAIIGAVTFKDDSLVERLDRRGFKSHWRLDPARDLGIVEPRAGLETIQERLTPAAARRIAQTRAPADLLIVRHILEHAYDTRSFVEALRALARPQGFIVFEVPDNARCFEKLDYGAIWEEHVLYFTRETFAGFFPRAGLEPRFSRSYPYAMEDSLVAVVRAAAKTAALPAPPAEEIRRARAYARGLPETGAKFRKLLADYPRERVALFGAGHRSATFVNLLGLKDLIGFIVDDDANKKGLLMPGSRLPILGSSALLEKGVALCLLNMSPESEEKVVAKNKAFTDGGGRFASIFPDSRYAAEALKPARSA